ncbi:MAG: hypothetical protein A2381_03460 [Bdellovibrionales bacterium RIFOXYB1_FULL_37_110]|nr:MAG: hypothetical protein A2417_03950 [Bdellovibrionales bacterium RIFOXYC1_FULL_37_79]OFZ57984.1 MAG: hypothetical protein A2381_03460 [Bdellovibrionales bacterium RIFOXYB1_FULL_37_110]OFZ63121.1 MAG: hypothetical protein A2577_15590 [Bdellovibrionales bacterium RIFOXYD1_FULL_36_51]
MFLLITISLPAFAKVEAFNYNFSLEILEDFYPDKTLESIEKKYNKGANISSNADYKIIKYLINHQRYTFPVFVQYYKDKSVDFYVRLPSYFMHDIFHESLIKKLGKQDTYSKYEESASYTWKNVKDTQHFYRAECTITCFPIFYSVITKKSDLPGYLPILKQMLKQSSWK